MTFASLRTAAVAAGAALLTCGALSLSQDAADAKPDVADSGLTLAGPTGDDAIEITRRGPSQIRAGEEFTYDLVLKNVSAEPIRGIRVTETTQGVQLRGASDEAAQVEGGRMTFNAGQLAAGAEPHPDRHRPRRGDRHRPQLHRGRLRPGPVHHV